MSGPAPVALTADEMKWSLQGALALPGLEQVNLVGEPGKPGPYTIRLKFPAGYKLAPHTSGSTRSHDPIWHLVHALRRQILKALPAGSFYTAGQPVALRGSAGARRHTSKRNGAEWTQLRQPGRAEIDISARSVHPRARLRMSDTRMIVVPGILASVALPRHLEVVNLRPARWRGPGGHGVRARNRAGVTEHEAVRLALVG
jgi:hypothetical protein